MYATNFTTQHDKWIFGCMPQMLGCIPQIISSDQYSHTTDVASGTTVLSSQTDNLHPTGAITVPPELELPPVHRTFDRMLSFPHVEDLKKKKKKKMAARAVCPVLRRRL